MSDGDLMCVRRVCERLAQPTHERKCPSCGFRTRPWTEAEAERLIGPATGVRPAAPTPVLIVTSNEIPGYQISEVHGDIFGLTVRARNYFSNLGATLRTVVGGEVAGYTKLLTDSRNEARGRLMQAARDVGANAVIAMRFDCNEIGDIMTEIAAYGTAVTIVSMDSVKATDSED